MLDYLVGLKVIIGSFQVEEGGRESQKKEM